MTGSKSAMSERDTSDFARLNDLSLTLWQIADLSQGLDEMLRATMEMLGADMGNVQFYDPQRKVLTIASQRGFKADFLKIFKEVSAEDDSGCGRSLRSGQRTIIEDVEADPEYEPYRAIAASAGYRAVQSTPLMSRAGRPLGMLSTHFAAPHRPSERELRQLDLYVRQAVGFIERAEAETALRVEIEARKASPIVEARLSASSNHRMTQLSVRRSMESSNRGMPEHSHSSDSPRKKRLANRFCSSFQPTGTRKNRQFSTSCEKVKKSIILRPSGRRRTGSSSRSL